LDTTLTAATAAAAATTAAAVTTSKDIVHALSDAVTVASSSGHYTGGVAMIAVDCEVCTHIRDARYAVAYMFLGRAVDIMNP
jgi:hypothetical protein